MKITEKNIVSMLIFLSLSNVSTEMMKNSNFSLISPSHPLRIWQHVVKSSKIGIKKTDARREAQGLYDQLLKT